MEKLYIVFDRIPSPNSGGLVTYYTYLAEILKDTYDIEIISIFNVNADHKKLFKNYKIINVSNYKNDLSFVNIGEYLNRFDILNILKSIFKMLHYFLFIPFARKATNSLINSNKCIVTSPSAAIFMGSKTNFILEIHSKYEFFWGDRLVSKMQVKLMTQPDIILFRSKSDMHKAAKHLDNVGYIYNFFDNSNIEPKIKITPTRKYLFIGRLSYEKNLFRLVDIAEILEQRGTSFEIDIYGNGPLKPDLENYINKKNLNQKVVLKGFCKDKKIYQKYDALLLTSDIEGYPLVIIEAKANGVPTITSNWGDAVNEIIINNENGIIFDNNEECVDAIIKIQNQNYLENLSHSAFEDFIRKYSIHTAKEKWIETLTKKGSFKNGG